MSFYSDPRNIHPGPVRGSAVEGLGHRVAISVRRILDSSIRNSSDPTTLVITPAARAVAPFTFVSAQNTVSATGVSDLSITRLQERPFARVKCTVTIPITVSYKDTGGASFVSQSQIAVPQDVIMYVPEASVFPFEIVSTASCHCTAGSFTASDRLSATICLTILTKVVADTDLLVPAYGICPSPRAVDFETESCSEFFDLPLYPRGRQAE